jgi:hypothetical protein
MRWKYNFLSALCMLFSANVLGQDSMMSSKLSSLWFHPYSASEFKSLVGMQASSFAHSHLVNGNLVGDVYRGKIVDQTKNSMFKGLGTGVRNGLGHQLQFSYINFEKALKKKPKTYGYISVSDESLIESRLNPDLVEMVLRGNAPFSGQTVSSNPMQLRFIHLQQIGVGAIHLKRNDRYHTKWYVQLNAIGGRNHQLLDFTESSFYTSETGDSIRFGFSGSQSGLPLNNRGYYNGVGASIDVGWLRSYDDYYISARINSLGGMRWGANYEQLIFDSDNTFQGLSWNDSDSRFGLPAYIGDSALYKLSSEVSRGPVWRSLPTDIQIKGGMRLKSHLVSLGLMYRNGGIFMPAVELSHEWMLTPHFRLSNSLLFSGYGRYLWFGQLDWAFAKRYQLQMGMGGLQMLWGHRGGGQLRLGLNVSL